MNATKRQKREFARRFKLELWCQLCGESPAFLKAWDKGDLDECDRIAADFTKPITLNFSLANATGVEHVNQTPNPNP